MSSIENLTGRLRNASLTKDSQHQPEPASPPKSFLQSMNEKLAQKPRKHKSRGKNSYPRGKNRTTAPRDPSLHYVVDNERGFLGVYSTTATATTAARIAGASDYLLSRWVEEGLYDSSTVRILPQKVRGMEIPGEAGTNSSKDTTEVNDTPVRPKNREPSPTAKTFPNDLAKTGQNYHDENATTKPTPTEDTTQKRDPSPKPDATTRKTPEIIYAALDRSLCLGLFTEKARAWEACIKHKTQMTYSVGLRDANQYFDKEGMPFLVGTIAGSGRHCWCVRLCVVDEMPRVRGKGL